ncbi:MAG: hypothetical protein HW402_1146 [Dehalococcoidales bacterium]|nr:hypothetical protein [Dehalococcoidales bacterium]
MSEPNNNSEGAGAKKTTLIAKIDQRVLPALDRIASRNQVNTSQLVCQFFSDVADSVDFLASAQGGSSDNIEDKFARLIVERCPGATPEALRAARRILE